MKILLTGKGYLASRWLQTATASSAQIVFMEGRIPDVDPTSVLEGVDVVVHLAGVVPPKGEKDPTLYDVVNHQWTTRLAKECLQRGVRLFFPSTSSVYDASDGALLKELEISNNIQGAYALAEFAAENELATLAKKGLQCAIVRFGSVFGGAPQISYDRVVNKFVKAASQGLPLTIQKDGMENLYPYTYVGDVASAINFFIERDIFSGEVFNVVSQNATMDEVVEDIRSLYPNTSVEFGNFGKKYSFGMDDIKIRALGFVPQGSLQLGIQEVAAALTHA
jgi:nucleoside-diphosphate-sugar epimerase